jgi:hypothetical protein
MVIMFNVLLVALAALIAYWWAHQGLFSALLHCVCVIAAGALALALWEPITVNFLLRGTSMDDYVWGTSLVLLFVIFLMAFRVALDKLAPGNVNFPSWVNYTFGSMVGAWSGILTIGIFLIGIGFIQSTNEIMGFVGFARGNNGQVSRQGSLFPPFHEWTAGFYSVLSNGAFKPYGSKPMRKVYPQLAAQSVGLQRDAFSLGTAKTSLAPSGAKIIGFFVSKETSPPQYMVQVEFDRPAYNHPDGVLTVSSGQIHLIGDPGEGWKEAPTAFPYQWSQPDPKGLATTYIFDDVSHYAQNVPGQEKVIVLFEFYGQNLGDREPKYVRIKGLRFRLPKAVELTGAQVNALRKTLKDPNATPVNPDPTAPKLAKSDLTIDNSIMPVQVTTNQVASMRHRDNFFTEGRETFPKGGGGIGGKSLRIKGVMEPEGTKVVKLCISRKKSSVDVYGDLLEIVKTLPDTARPYLIDEQGGQYTPIGYIWIKPNDVEIFLDRTNGVASKKDLPSQPTAATHDVWLYFAITKGARIKAFMLGETTIAVTDTLIEE